MAVRDHDWQFGITTVYHFIFVPLTIGLSALVAVMQTIWHVKKDPLYLRMTKFFGALFLINFAMGVVTGIVQEFQFGMNWSDYSRFVGDVFGAPLAMEGLLAFFLESTFLGLWIFGWDKLPPRLHLATIWLATIGTNLSAYFILAANSWMQHPVGYRINPVTHRAELTSIGKLLTNSTTLVTYPHVLAGAFITHVAGGGPLGHRLGTEPAGVRAGVAGRRSVTAIVFTSSEAGSLPADLTQPRTPMAPQRPKPYPRGTFVPRSTTPRTSRTPAPGRGGSQRNGHRPVSADDGPTLAAGRKADPRGGE